MAKSVVRVYVQCTLSGGKTVEVTRTYRPEVLDTATAEAIVDEVSKALDEGFEVEGVPSESKG